MIFGQTKVLNVFKNNVIFFKLTLVNVWVGVRVKTHKFIRTQIYRCDEVDPNTQNKG